MIFAGCGSSKGACDRGDKGAPSLGAGKIPLVPARADGARRQILLLCPRPLVPWTQGGQDTLHGIWLRVYKAAYWLTPSYARVPFRLPSDSGGCQEVQLRVLLVQALARHIEQFAALPDGLLEQMIA